MNYPEHILKRFWIKINIPEDWKEKDQCWEWTAYCDKDGYGHFTLYDTNVVRSSRFVYEQYNGPIPEGKLVCHTCDNPPCCNPNHLFLGTIKENSHDMVRKGRAPEGRKEFGSEFAILTELDIQDILNMKYKNFKEISENLGVAHNTINSIFTRRTWKSITNNYSDDELKTIKNKLYIVKRKLI